MTPACETIRQLIEETLGEGKLDGFDDLVHQDYVDHIGGMDREAFRAFLGSLLTGISNRDARLERCFSSEDQVAWRWSLRGEHTGELLGIPPTGNKLDVTGNDLGVMRDGKLVESWGETDMMALMTQVGAIEPPNS